MLIEFSGNINKENWEPGDEARAVQYFMASVHVVTDNINSACIHTTNDNKCETVYLSCSVSWGERPATWVHCCVEEIQGCQRLRCHFDATQVLTNLLLVSHTVINLCII